MKILFILFFIIGLYIVLSAYLYFRQEEHIFFPTGISELNRPILRVYQEFEVTVQHDDITLHGWFIHNGVSSNNPVIIYYGGNAEEVSNHLYELDRFEKGSFLFMNYRGYGRSAGSPSEKNLFGDALFIFDYFVDKYNLNLNHIILFGRSLGAGVATYVSKHRKVKAVILISPFDSMVNVAKDHYPFFPVKFLLKHKFDSISLAPEINSPLLVIAGGTDRIIRKERSLNLVRQWGGKSEYVVIENAGHNDISRFQEYWDAINFFLLNLK